MPAELVERARAAQADSLEVQGSLRERAGGATAAPRDLQLMAAGFEAPGVNSGDVTGPDPDLDAARAFYAARGVRWGLRVPTGAALAARPPALTAAPDGRQARRVRAGARGRRAGDPAGRAR